MIRPILTEVRAQRTFGQVELDSTVVVADFPVNYFVYPHVEVDGRTWQGRLEKQFSYREE